MADALPLSTPVMVVGTGGSTGWGWHASAMASCGGG